MDAVIMTNLQSVYKKTKQAIGLLMDRDSELEPEHCDRHEKEIKILGEVLGHLGIVERAMWDD